MESQAGAGLIIGYLELNTAKTSYATAGAICNGIHSVIPKMVIFKSLTMPGLACFTHDKLPFMKLYLRSPFSGLFVFSMLLINLSLQAQEQTWKHLATDLGDLPLPWKSTEQTAALVADLDKDGLNDFVLACRKQAPALVWYQRKASGWTKYIIDDQVLPIEAGGVAYDVDGDGDLDLVFGGDWQSSSVWWWENPYPQMNYHWKRHLIKSEGATQHHDQLIGKFRHDEQSQLVFWNQGSRTLYMAAIPSDPKTDNWEYHTIYQASAAEEQHGAYVEGLAAGDVDGDGYTDIIAGDCWLKYDSAVGRFKAIHYATAAGRVAVGKFKAGKTLQIVVSPGDGTGPASWYECIGNPEDEKAWIGHLLAGRDLVHGHSLQVADINGDGNLDIFVAEMVKWTEAGPAADNPNAEAMIFFGDGKGGFTKTIFQKGIEFHEARIADLDGDGDLDILCKPYSWRTPRIDIWLQHGTGRQLESLDKIIPSGIGLEIYSLRREMQNDFDGTLKRISDMGLSELEVGGFYGLSAEQFREALKRHHLKASSMLFGYEMFRDSLDRVIAYAHALGVSLVGCAWIPHEKEFTKGDALKAAALFNKVGETLQAKGFHFIYHPHGYEFAPQPDGATLFDYLAANMKPGIADFELDVFWAYHAGADPALLLRRYPGRFVALHLKQMKAGQPTGIYTGNAPDESSVALGNGVIDISTLLQVAMQTGVSRYYIEDESPAALSQLKSSLVYLNALGKRK